MERAASLLKMGENVNSFNYQSLNSLHAAMMDFLLLNRGEVNAHTDGGMAPLHIATFRNNAAYITKLLNQGPNVNLHYL